MYAISLALAAILGHLALTSVAGPVAGSPTADSFPPNGTNVDTVLFPDRTVVGYPHATATGAEGFAYATAPAAQFSKIHDAFGSVFNPQAKGKTSKDFSPLFALGTLTPAYSLPPDTFGGGKATPVVPDQCTLDEVHMLFRHGARYPSTVQGSSYSFPAKLYEAATNGTFSAKGELSFLNDWTYKLGNDILNAFGRQQCYNLGVRSRIAYGHLLNDFVEKGALPVFRTGSIDRMAETMETFGQGFFGRDADKQFNTVIAIEEIGFNATVYPAGTCPNVRRDMAAGALAEADFISRAFVGTAQRLQADIEGMTVTPEDVSAMLTLCAYETLSLGYSKFCPLFTEEEFLNNEYASDLSFYYSFGPGAQSSAAQGKGWVQEFLARLTHTPIEVYDTSTNSTLVGNPQTFPLDQSFYADATHDTFIMTTLVALNLPAMDTFGRLPTDVNKAPRNRAFVTSRLIPFNTNLVAQVLTCKKRGAPQIRNDAIIPLDKTYEGCKSDHDGLCDLATVVAVLKKNMDEIDYQKDCFGPIANITDVSQLQDGHGRPY